MTLNSWQEMAKLKANLVQIVDVLLTDKVTTREEIAFDLWANIESLNTLEGDLIKHLRNKQMRNLYNKCEEIEMEREESRNL